MTTLSPFARPSPWIYGKDRGACPPSAEEWLPVVGFEGRYEVSNIGRVRNISGHIMSQHLDGRGYWQIGLRRHGEKETLKVHRLVCRAFHGAPEAGQEVGHLDGVRNNASADNLAWISRSENSLQAVGHGTHRGFTSKGAGERHPRARLTASAVASIRARAARGETHSSIGRDLGFHRNHIGNIVQGRRWKS